MMRLLISMITAFAAASTAVLPESDLEARSLPQGQILAETDDYEIVEDEEKSDAGASRVILLPTEKRRRLALHAIVVSMIGGCWAVTFGAILNRILPSSWQNTN